MMNILNYIPQNGFCYRLFVVGPYPMDTYIQKIQRDLSFIQTQLCEIVVYVDESWNQDIVDKIRKLPNAKVVLVKTLTSIGIVHAKMYFLECQNSIGKKCSTLITGSGNASNNGMKNNAEVMTVARLAQLEKRSQCEIKKYFESFIGNKECIRVKEVNAKFKNQVGKSSIILPSLQRSDKTRSFYSWLRSGMLFYKYEKDQNFGYIVINLEEPLPGNKRISRYIKNSIFDSGKDLQQTLRYRYLDNLEENKNAKNISPTRFALESAFGYWISRDCFNDMKDEIFPNRIVSDLKECVGEKKQKKEKIIKNKVERSLKAMAKNKILRECIGSKINDVENIVKNKLDRDFRMASDEHFVFRYKTGYDYHKMPNFDESDFEDFINTIFASCLIKQKGNAVLNLLAQKIKKVLQEKSILFDDADKLAGWLNDNWNSLYEIIRFYYRNEIKLVQQKNKTDSGLACISMLVNKSYSNVKKKAYEIFSSRWGKNNNFELNSNQMKKLLNTLKENSCYRFRPFKSWNELKGMNLLCVREETFEKKEHWVISEKIDDLIQIYDPIFNSPIEVSQWNYKNIQRYIRVFY